MRITSTHVENTAEEKDKRKNVEDHLHTRGEYNQLQACHVCVHGSPPHTWRILQRNIQINHVAGITSTHVENTLLTSTTWGRSRDHLHTRGEYPPEPVTVYAGLGSPPHTWRILITIRSNKTADRITSTHVENTPSFLLPIIMS